MSSIKKVKDLLKDYRAIHARIINLNRQLTNMCKDETQDEAIAGQFLSAVPYDKQPGKPRDCGGSTRHFVIQYDKMDESDIKDREKEKQKLTKTVEENTEKLEHINESLNSLTLEKKEIIIDRYIGVFDEKKQGYIELSWEEIAEKMGYERTWCIELHNQGLNYIVKSLPEYMLQ